MFMYKCCYFTLYLCMNRQFNKLNNKKKKINIRKKGGNLNVVQKLLLISF